jgi:hypothetical protein
MRTPRWACQVRGIKFKIKQTFEQKEVVLFLTADHEILERMR